MLVLALLLIAQTAPPAEPPSEPPAEDIIVTAVRSKCSVRLADKVLSNPEFDRRAKDWAAGVPVRVIAPRSADYKCLAKIAFRLADHGVKRMTFVDSPGGAPVAPVTPSN